MRDFLNKVKSTPWYQALRKRRHARRQARELRDWERRGRPAPPPHLVKQKLIKDYAQRYGLRVLVETGTYLGDMVEAMRNCFDRIYSIEVGKELSEKAKERFKSAKHVEIIHGDSGEELRRLVPTLDRPALFFLDGHYSGLGTARGTEDTPVLDELRHILGSSEKRHVIVIDDARCFGTDPAYPSIEDLTRFVHSLRSAARISVEDDSIRVTPD